MAIRCVVLDFDGTFTDLSIEALPFGPAIRRAWSDVLGRDVSAEWDEIEGRILAEPLAYGWEYEQKIVAPAAADPYLRSSAIAQAILDRASLMRDPAVRTAIIQSLYGYAYSRTLDWFKPDAKEALDALLALPGVAVTVVTNSATKAVSAKLDKLGLAAREKLKVIGDAMKFHVTDSAAPGFARIAPFEKSPELPRPIYLRRGKYYDKLAEIWTATGAGAAETLVFGDIYELDLALPAAAGCQIALVQRGNTLPYEAERVAAHRGSVLDSLAALLPLVRGQP